MLSSDGKIRIESRKGAVIEIDASTLKPGARLQAALDKLLEGGSLSELTPLERKGLAAKKSLIGSGDNALIVRFDVKVVRIDERVPIDLGRLAKRP